MLPGGWRDEKKVGMLGKAEHKKHGVIVEYQLEHEGCKGWWKRGWKMRWSQDSWSLLPRTVAISHMCD